MNKEKEQRFLAYAQTLYASESSTFYKERWGKMPDHFFDIPPVAREAVACVPVAARRYVVGKGLVHATDNGMYERTLEAIAQETYTPVELRQPLVAFADSRMALEVSVWAYAHNMLPLIAEHSIETTRYAALEYGIDSMISDERKYRELFLHTSAPHVSVVDSSFTAYEPGVRYVWSIPGLGAFAEACACSGNVFHAQPHAYVEPGAPTIVSKDTPLPTPVVRWEVPYATKRHSCACGVEGFILL